MLLCSFPVKSNPDRCESLTYIHYTEMFGSRQDLFFLSVCLSKQFSVMLVLTLREYNYPTGR